ncbi:glyoxalase [archaeon]|nr:MAG: glyoxalase [archaeon]
MSATHQEEELVVQGFHHFGILVQDVNKAKEFYLNILGLQDESHLRHVLPYPGAFIKCGVNQIHLMQLPSPDKDTIRPEYAGHDKHIAIAVSNVEAVARRLKRHNIAFNMSSSGRKALFTRDFDNNALEFTEVV